MASITLVQVLGIDGLLGLGPAIVLACSGSASGGLTGAGLALLGGVALEALGVAALALGATALVSGPALWLAGRRSPAHAT